MSTINFDDKIFSQQILQQVLPLIAPMRAFARDFSSEASAIGNAIAVPLVGTATATTFSQASDVYEQTGGSVSAITVSLTSNHIVPVDITDLQALNNSPARAEVFAQSAANALAGRVWSTIAGLVTSTNFGAIVTTLAAASWGVTQVRKLKLTLDQRDVTKMGRSLFIPVEVEDALLDRKSTRLNSSHVSESRMPSSA